MQNRDSSSGKSIDFVGTNMLVCKAPIIRVQQSPSEGWDDSTRDQRDPSRADANENKQNYKGQ